MKSLMDIIVLSVAFWMGGIKLLVALHTPSATESISSPPLEVEERPDPEIEAIQQKATLAQVKASEARKETFNRAASEKAAKEEAALNKMEAEKTKKQLEDLKKEKEQNDEKIKQEELRKEESRKNAERETSEKAKRSNEEKKSEVAFHWSSNLDEAKEQAYKTGIPVYVAFEGEGCKYCVALNKYVYGSSRVSPILRKEFIPVWLYSSSEDDNHRAEFQKGKPDFPLAVVIQPNGKWKSFTPKFDEHKTTEENIDVFLDQLEEFRI